MFVRNIVLVKPEQKFNFPAHRRQPNCHLQLLLGIGCNFNVNVFFVAIFRQPGVFMFTFCYYLYLCGPSSMHSWRNINNLRNSFILDWHWIAASHIIKNLDNVNINSNTNYNADYWWKAHKWWKPQCQTHLQSKSLWQTDFSLLQSSMRPTGDDRRGTMKVVIRRGLPSFSGSNKTIIYRYRLQVLCNSKGNSWTCVDIYKVSEIWSDPVCVQIKKDHPWYFF